MTKKSDVMSFNLYKEILDKIEAIDGPFDERIMGTLDAVIANIKLQEANKLNVRGVREQANYIMELLGKEKTFKLVEDALSISLTTKKPITKGQAERLVPNLFF